MTSYLPWGPLLLKTLKVHSRRQVAATCRSNKSPRVHWRIFVKTFSLQKNFVYTTSPTNSVI